MGTRLPPGNRAPVRVLAGLEALDGTGAKLGKLVRDAIPSGPAKDVLSGSWLGHPLHPLLTDVTLGTLTSALALDIVGGRESAPAARRLIGLGLLSALPTALSGTSDWGDREVGSPAARRVGLAHAAANVVATSLFAASWVARKRGGSGRGLALVGGAALGVSGQLGGHLVFAEGIGVDHTVFESGPDTWTAVLDDGELAEDAPRCVEADGTAVMVVRTGGSVYALSDHCAHDGGPLHEGELADCRITCPWHHSVFDVRDGALVHGPAAYPQPAWDARVREGRVEVRRR